MKLTTKLLITALSFSILTACGPKGPSKEQIAAEEQAKVAYETVKSDFEKYKEWRDSANKTIKNMNSTLSIIRSEKDPNKVIGMYETLAKEFSDVSNRLNAIQFTDTRFSALKTKGIEGFKTLSELILESTKYVTTEVTNETRLKMINQRNQAINIVNKELGELEDNVVKEINADTKKYNEIRRENDKLRRQ
jgi:lipoprotein